jgi:hypothetical protein
MLDGLFTGEETAPTTSSDICDSRHRVAVHLSRGLKSKKCREAS